MYELYWYVGTSETYESNIYDMFTLVNFFSFVSLLSMTLHKGGYVIVYIFTDLNLYLQDHSNCEAAQ